MVIIPTYNERGNISRLIPELLHLSLSPDVLVIDDNSPDGTGEMLNRLKLEFNKKIHVIHRPAKLGLGTAYLTGFKYGFQNHYPYILTMDADFSHDPKYIPYMMDKAGPDCVVIGSRYIAGGGTRNWGFYRRILSRTANMIARHTLGFSCHDCTAGFRLYSSQVLAGLDLDTISSCGYSCLIEILFRCRRAGVRINEVPIIFIDRTYGKSKLSRFEIFRAVVTLARCRFTAKNH